MAVFIKRHVCNELGLYDGIIKNLAEESYVTSVTNQLFAMVAMTCKSEISLLHSAGKLKLGRCGVSEITSAWVLSHYPDAKYEVRTTYINTETDEVDFFILYY